jgi:hypothetical protein
VSLTAGARLGTYQIVSALGAGGMGRGESRGRYDAGRQVAIKILPDAVASDPRSGSAPQLVRRCTELVRRTERRACQQRDRPSFADVALAAG